MNDANPDLSDHPDDRSDDPDKPNPLFALASQYALYRQAMVPHEKLRGYLLTLAARARAARKKEDEEAAVKSEPAERVKAQRERDENFLSAGTPGSGAHTIGSRGRRTPTVHVLDRDGRPFGGDLTAKPYYSPQKKQQCFGVQFVRPSGAAKLPAGTRCRVFVLDPALVARAVALAGDLPRAFEPARVSASRELARLLSAVPDLDGRVTDDGSLEIPSVLLPEACSEIGALPAGAAVVLVIDARGDAR